MVNHLEQAFHHLPPSRSHDREETLRLLLAVANCMKDCGNALYKANDYKQAITAYRQSIKIYELIETDQQYALSQILLKSNLVNALRQAKHYPDAVEEGISALNNLPSDPCFSVFHNKIVFHMVHAVCAMIDSNTLGQDSLLMLKVYNRLSAERERISPNYREKLSEFFSKIETFCQSSSSLRHLNRFFGTCRDEGQSQPETSSLISHDLASRLG
jgi:tetratricopeptide (TPR) repeat protein